MESEDQRFTFPSFSQSSYPCFVRSHFSNSSDGELIACEFTATGFSQRCCPEDSSTTRAGELLRSRVYEIVAGKELRIDGNIFRRDFRNYSDDDTLLDTGISFPIAFASAEVHGEEVQIAVPRWRRFSGSVSYSNQTGVGQGPITGGLFLGDAAAGVSDTSKFPVSQDQRNTVRARTRFQATERLWLAATAEYGSGLPVDLGGPVDLRLLYDPAIWCCASWTR